MQNWVKRLCIGAVAAVLAATVAVAGPKKVAKGPIAGEDDYRSAIGYTVAVMEHCKALNRLTKTKGSYNGELAREHAGEVVRNAESATRHVSAYVATTGAGTVTVAETDKPSLGTAEANFERASEAFTAQTKGGTSDRTAVSASATELYLAAKDMLTATKASGKALGIATATPPRKPGQTPKKPRTPKMPKAPKKSKKTPADDASASAK